MRDEYDAELIRGGVRGKYAERYRAGMTFAKVEGSGSDVDASAEHVMSLTQLLPDIRALPRHDKLRLIQVLAEELAEAEEVFPVQRGATYPLWSPHDAYEGAATLLQALKDEEGKP